jgi:SagB-type dehydrogenase family enzyme
VPGPTDKERREELSNRDIEAARTFHQVTAHSYTSVRAMPHTLDWDNRPLPYKIYPEAGVVVLSRDLELSGVSALTAVRGEVPIDLKTSVDLETITRLLFCAGGLTRSLRVDGQPHHFRAAPSAGALYPIEIYLAATQVEGLEAGLYHFSPADLRLRGLRRGDWRMHLAKSAGMGSSILEARALLVMSAIFWRSAWKYRARAYRYCLWDSGTVLANLLAAANADGLQAEVVTCFADSQVEALIEVDGEREGVICVVALGRTAPAREESPELRPLELDTIPLSATEVSYPDLVRIHSASRLASSEEAREIAEAPIEPAHLATPGPAAKPVSLGDEAGMGLGDTILRRGSTRVFAREAIDATELATIMAASSGHPQIDFPRLTETYVIVHAVGGLDPGAYYYRRENHAFELLKSGDFRAQAGYLCLEQPLGADCSAVIVYMCNLERILASLGNRGYRDAHLEAGLLGGRAYLAAYALERGATGLTFYDEDTSRFFEPHAAGMSPLLIVALGVPRRHESSRDDAV